MTRLSVQAALSLVVGVVAIVWPDPTLTTVATLVAVWTLGCGGFSLAAAFADSPGREARSGPLLVLAAVTDVVAGLAVFAWPEIGTSTLARIVAAWAVLTGVLQIVGALADPGSGRHRGLLVLGGLLAVGLAVVLGLRPDVAVETLADAFGLYCIASCGLLLILAASLSADMNRAEGGLRVG